MRGESVLQYFIRRLLLAIPTFIGCTIVVFTIVKIAPGGPLDQKMRQLKAGAGAEGAASTLSSQGSGQIPEAALEEFRRAFKEVKLEELSSPWYSPSNIPTLGVNTGRLFINYLEWLGVAKSEVESFYVEVDKQLKTPTDEYLVLRQEGGQYVVRHPGDNSVADGWEYEKKTLDGRERLRIFRREFSGILTLDFGNSTQYHEPVMKVFLQRIPVSVQFGIIGLFMTYCVCLYLGVQKALRHGSKFDFVTSSMVLIAYSVPGWALGAVLQLLFGTDSFLDILPLAGFSSNNYDTLSLFEKIFDRAYHFILPMIAYSIGSFATLTLLTKNSLLENLSQDYVRTAFAKGIKEKRVIWLHAMRNSIIPMAANIGHLIGIFLAGSFLVEHVFNIQGIGLLSYEAVLARDYPIVFAFTVFSVVTLLIGNIISDFILALTDPRIRFN